MTSSPGVDEGPQGHIDAGLGAVGHGDLLGGVLHAAVGLQALADGLAQLHRAAGGSVAGLVVLDGGNTRLFDIVRRIEVGFSGSKPDPRPAPRLSSA